MKEIIVKDGNLFVVPTPSQKPERTVNEILSIVKNSDVHSIQVNLCNLNMFDALKVATLTAAYGLTKNLSDKYEMIVADEITRAQIQLLSLSNLKVVVERKNERKIVTTKKLFAIEV